MPEPVVPKEGWGVLHLFLKVDHAAARQLPPGAAKELVDVLERWAERMQLHLFSVLGHKADVMVMALDEDLAELRALQTAIETAATAPAVRLDWSYLSLTETSEYTPTEDDERERLQEAGVEGEDFERRLEKFRDRIAGYNEHKLHPEMPEWELACFYPMSHRREGDDNWYALEFDRRRDLMHEHGKSGRAFTGRVLQLVSGSTGLDDWEWAVTLFAHDIADIKEIVYDLRYDEASARFAEFGPFVIGMRRTPAELVADIGLTAGSDAP